MTQYIIYILGAAFLLNLIGIIAVAFAFRKRHRYLFNRILELSEQDNNLKDRLRKEIRLLEIQQLRNLNNTPQIPIRFTAQAGEDILIYDFFKNRDPGFFVEAGAYDGVTFSNTYLLESLGWRGMLVEPHPRQFELCKANRPGSSVVHAALGPDGSDGKIEFTCADDQFGQSPLSFVKADQAHINWCIKENFTMEKVMVPFTSLNALLASHNDVVDLLSVDVEGMELELLQGFNIEKFRPEVIIVEQHGDDRDTATSDYLKDHGYEAVAEVGCNMFFVPMTMSESFASLLYEGDEILKKEIS